MLGSKRNEIGIVNGPRKKIAILAFFIMTIMVISMFASSASAYRSTTTTTTESTINVAIQYATYTDLDADNNTDDVWAIVEFNLTDSNIYQFYYIITLILPSGIYFEYIVYVWAWVDVVTINNLFFNHATEKGDYVLIVEALLVSPDVDYDSHVYVFDPPGGSDGGKPSFGVA